MGVAEFRLSQYVHAGLGDGHFATLWRDATRCNCDEDQVQQSFNQKVRARHVQPSLSRAAAKELALSIRYWVPALRRRSLPRGLINKVPPFSSGRLP